MDPISQAVVGTMAAVATVSGQKKVKKLKEAKGPSLWAIALWGALGGMAPDLDILIRSSSDPLFHVQYHRHFTHSLFFIPLGALVVSLFLKLFRVPIKRSYLYTFLGYATHGLLDAFTNYGTQLFWPLSSTRVALNTVSVIDPLCTIPLLILVGCALKFSKPRLNYLAISYLAFFLYLGHYQNMRVTRFLINEGKINNDSKRFMVKPTIFNNVIWRAIVDDGSYAHFYAVKSIPFGAIKLYEKSETAPIVKEEQVKNLLSHYQSKNFMYDYERFKHFTDGFLHWGEKSSIVDSRYSMLPYSANPMWTIEFHQGEGHANFVVNRDISIKKRKEFLNLLLDF